MRCHINETVIGSERLSPDDVEGCRWYSYRLLILVQQKGKFPTFWSSCRSLLQCSPFHPGSSNKGPQLRALTRCCFGALLMEDAPSTHPASESLTEGHEWHVQHMKSPTGVWFGKQSPRLQIAHSRLSTPAVEICTLLYVGVPGSAR